MADSSHLLSHETQVSDILKQSFCNAHDLAQHYLDVRRQDAIRLTEEAIANGSERRKAKIAVLFWKAAICQNMAARYKKKAGECDDKETGYKERVRDYEKRAAEFEERAAKYEESAAKFEESAAKFEESAAKHGKRARKC